MNISELLLLNLCKVNVKDKKCIGIKSIDEDISPESLSCLLSTIHPIKISISQTLSFTRMEMYL